MNNPQKIADTYGFEPDRAFETWRSWNQQWLLKDLERRLQGERTNGRAKPSSRLARVISWLLAAMVIAGAFALAYVYRWLLR